MLRTSKRTHASTSQICGTHPYMPPGAFVRGLCFVQLSVPMTSDPIRVPSCVICVCASLLPQSTWAEVKSGEWASSEHSCPDRHDF